MNHNNHIPRHTNNHSSSILLSDANKSSHETFLQLIHSTFFHSCTLALHKHIHTQLRQKQNQTSYHITQKDIDYVYTFIQEIGKKWIDKLKKKNEYEICNLVQVVLTYGHFLEEFDLSHYEYEYDYRNDDDDEDRTDLKNGHGQSSGNVCSIEFNQNDDDNDDVDSQQQQGEGELNHNTKEKDQHSTITTIDSTRHDNNENIPFVSLMNIGCHHEDINKEQSQELQRTSNEWHPLPSLLSSSPHHDTTTNTNNNKNNNNTNNHNQYNGLNHIPKIMNLQPNELKSLSSHQLYISPSSTTSSSSMIIHPPPTERIIQIYIHIIDQLGWDNNTMWYYDWNIIDKACIRNKNRTYLQYNNNVNGQKRKFIDCNDDIDEENTAGIGNDDDDNNDDNDNGNGNNEIIITNNNDRARLVLTNDQTQKNENSNITTSRMASDLGSMKWTWDDIVCSFSQEELDNLCQTMMHDDHDECKKDGDDNDDSQKKNDKSEQCHKCLGALKIIGNMHLWEQLKQNNNWNGYTDDPIAVDTTVEEEEAGNNHDTMNELHIQKRRKKAYSKAKRQRLYPNVETKRVENISKLTSKVVFAESLASSKDCTDDNCYTMEFDLGECMMSLNFSNDDGKMGLPRNFMFRSLEVTLEE